MRPAIFVSYSHDDSALVGPVVALLRASKALVFRDADQLQPGKKWREQLDTAISGAAVIVVFWCNHSSASEEVEKEYTAAIAQNKDVLPLLIDDTPLPSNLAEYQFIDFRGVFPQGHAIGEPLSATPPPRRRSRALLWVGALVVLLIILALLVASFFALNQSSIPDYLGPTNHLGVFELSPWLLVLIVVVLVFQAVRGLRNRSQSQDTPAPAPAPPVDHLIQQQHELAHRIERELLTRTGTANGS